MAYQNTKSKTKSSKNTKPHQIHLVDGDWYKMSRDNETFSYMQYVYRLGDLNNGNYRFVFEDGMSYVLSSNYLEGATLFKKVTHRELEQIAKSTKTIGHLPKSIIKGFLGKNTLLSRNRMERNTTRNNNSKRNAQRKKNNNERNTKEKWEKYRKDVTSHFPS